MDYLDWAPQVEKLRILQGDDQDNSPRVVNPDRNLHDSQVPQAQLETWLPQAHKKGAQCDGSGPQEEPDEPFEVALASD